MTEEHEDEVSRLTVILLRALPNWSQTELAEASGIHRSQISHYETGDAVPRPRNRQRLAAAVGMEPVLLAHLESFLSGLLTAWRNGQSSAPAATPPRPPAAGKAGARVAEIVVEEITHARAELALLGGVRRRPEPQR